MILKIILFHSDKKNNCRYLPFIQQFSKHRVVYYFRNILTFLRYLKILKQFKKYRYYKVFMIKHVLNKILKNITPTNFF